MFGRAKMLNDCVPIVEGPYDNILAPRVSQIPDAGMGLFYDGNTAFHAERTICYYSGRIHNFYSSHYLRDKSYLMLLGGDVLVDPGPLKQIKARYINDPLNETLRNVKYVPDVPNKRAAVVSLRRIEPGEELFVSYGSAYWAQQESPRKLLTVKLL
jgi:SET domain